ncbi:hypothetical protein U5640_36200 [Streptomyces sp. SS7]|uniref:hypothetical protein n=1 Tax=Streptomyces sp. SS7 TaxID=3108485 RepID=UPI0030EB52EC
MTREERRESIRRLVYAAPVLPAEDIDHVRRLLPGLRRPAPAAPTAGLPAPSTGTAAA